MRFARVVLVCAALFVLSVVAQSPNGAINGQVLDPSGGAIADARIVIVNDLTGLQYITKTNDEGIYVLPNLPPGPYRLQVSKVGFKTLIKPDIILNVQDALAISFTLPIGALAETVTVEGGAPLINTESAAVSTVVDRQFAENLPMNGRSFQALIQLTPGVVLTASSGSDNGQFSVNGQRASSNYWMVDGVSANIGIGIRAFAAGNGPSGANAGLSVLGGTNSLVSVDALQEFRIQTSTYAPEFGRTPGGQVSIVTRAGTNHWHGSAFDYLRNDLFDANDWFADANKLPKPKERQNDFGGTLSGRILKDRTFFFFSYEGLRLRLPQVAESLVPDLSARQAAVQAMQPYLNAFPLPNGPAGTDNLTTGVAQFNASYSNSASLDAYSIRIDHKLNDKLTLFGRYNRSPSTLIQRGVDSGTLNTVVPSQVTLQTASSGLTWTLSPNIVNDLRFNYSRTISQSHAYVDGFGGAVPLTSLPFPSGFNASNGLFDLAMFPFGFTGPQVGFEGKNLQRQVNLVEGLTLQKGSHNLKFGVDFRRLSPVVNTAYIQEVAFLDVPSFASGNLLASFIGSGRPGTFFLHNLGAFAQDTWKMSPRVTITYGLRWDLDFAPSSSPALLAVNGFNLSDLSHLALAPGGTPPFQTTYGNVAPRIGIAYHLAGSQARQTVLRGGFGFFFDLATSELGNAVQPDFYPLGASVLAFGGTFPLSSATAAPPPITIASVQSSGVFGVFDPHLKLPYTLQWNLSVEQALGARQTVSATYVGSAGRRLMQSARVDSPNANFAFVGLTTNASTSDYDALQLQFQRRLSRGLQALASYSWSHSIDTASAGSLFGNQSNGFLPGLVNQNRGPSDFDVRNAFSAGVTYDIPAPKINAFTNTILHGWSVENIIQARSAQPVTVFDGSFTSLENRTAQIRPDLVPGLPLYLFGAQYPGGKIFNNTPNQGGPGCLGPFCPPPTDANGNPLRQGDLPRNALRGFGATQWDFAVHRDFNLRESLKVQFRAEMFNILNHPNFAPPVADIANTTQFGRSTQTLGNFLSGGNVGNGGFSPLYQIGGPRSVQFGLKCQF
jgi:hypothetical protein